MRNLLLAAFLLLLPAAARAETVFEALGGRPGLVRIVDEAARRWTADPRIAETFAETNMTRFRVKLVDHLCMVTGGGCGYTGPSIQMTHKGLHLRQRDFNALAEDLQDAMEALGIAYATQNRLIALLAPMQRQVVSQ